MKLHVLAALAAAALVLAVPAAAAVGTLHSFAGPEGQTPAAPLVQGTDGFLYGAAAHGGDLSVLSPDGAGTIFRTDLAGSVTTLHLFDGAGGAVPTGVVQGRDGALYGTTTYGGDTATSSLTPGNGTIFRLSPTGAFTTLFVFPGGERGFRPGPLLQGSDGALYGTAVGGQTLYALLPGVVYRFDPVTRDYRILHTFVISDGRDPTGKLFEASDGFFYGTTNEGGPSNAGVVYKVNAAGSFAVVHAFSTFEGSEPKAGVFQASDGLFYGTLEQGGYGGRVFRMDGAGNVTTLFSFGPYSADGWAPTTNPIEGRDGFLYGTTPRGGTSPSGSYGVVYRLSKTGSLAVLHSFSGPDGIQPWAAPVQASDGKLYGSTIVGGASGLGTLWRLDPGSTQPAPLPKLAWLAIPQSIVKGGYATTGTVTLTGVAPAGGASVALASSSSLASVPSRVVVPGGAKTASFAITTMRTKRTAGATITASYNGSQATAALTILH
jgi:uncharacterized repeat protein (TIGR03803 family)